MDLTNTFGAFKSAMLPADWTSDPQKTTANMSMKSCYSPIHDEVTITFFRRSGSVTAESISLLKSTLSRPAHRIPDASQELINLAPVLGHAGDHQWASPTGARDTTFRLIQAETMVLKVKTVLYIRGTFLDPQDRKGINEYCGIFLDVPKDSTAVEEVFLQVPCKLGIFQFEQYRKVFLQVLESMEWK
jgi:hypothetical protein